MLTDIRGCRRTAGEIAGYGEVGTVFVFLNSECPLVQLYTPRLNALHDDFHARGVRLIGVYCNYSDHLLSIAAHAQDRDFSFPVFKDESHRLADELKIERTPEVVLLDKDFVVRYRGLIDDQYRAGGRSPQADKHYLRDAITQLLAGEEIKTPATLATGCLVELDDPTPLPAEVTYSKDIAPIIGNKCVSCHRPGQVAPFSLQNYKQVKRHARMIAEVVHDRRMPPYQPVFDEKRFGPLLDDHRLTDDEIRRIQAWVQTGVPEGDPNELPAPKEWPADWTLGEPDVVFSMEEEYAVPAEGNIPYQYLQAALNFDEDRWIKAAEVRPGAPSVVHHVLVHAVDRRLGKTYGRLAIWRLYGTRGEKAHVIGGYLPGRPVFSYGDDHAMRLPAGTKLMFECHYTPNGTPAKDRSSIGFHFADGPPKYEVLEEYVAGRNVHVPAHATHHAKTDSFVFETDSYILNVSPHMHFRGKDFRFELEYKDGKKETLLSIPRYDYDWQGVYQFAKPVFVPAGTRMIGTGHWDNSVYNANNPDPSVDVKWGVYSFDEMMNFRVQFTHAKAEDPPPDQIAVP